MQGIRKACLINAKAMILGISLALVVTLSIYSTLHFENIFLVNKVSTVDVIRLTNDVQVV